MVTAGKKGEAGAAAAASNNDAGGEEDKRLIEKENENEEVKGKGEVLIRRLTWKFSNFSY